MGLKVPLVTAWVWTGPKGGRGQSGGGSHNAGWRFKGQSGLDKGSATRKARGTMAGSRVGVERQPASTAAVGSSHDRGKERVIAGGDIRFRCVCLLEGERDLNR